MAVKSLDFSLSGATNGHCDCGAFRGHPFLISHSEVTDLIHAV